MASSALAQVSDAAASELNQAGDDIVALADAGVQRLRQYVLGLALHGRLCPTSVGERTADGLPVGWSWTAVGELGECVLGKMLDRTKHRSGTSRPYLRNINIRWGTFDLSDLLEMFFEDDELERYETRPGDVLICEGGEPGRSAVWTDRKPALIQKAIHRVRPGPRLLPDWLVLNLRYDSWTHRLDAHFTGATIKHFTGQALRAYTIRLPSLAEQKRIVAKVDQFMALCDELEAKQTKKREVRDRLTKAALATLTSAATLEEYEVAWKRVAENVHFMFDHREAIGGIRNTVLSLAVRGRIEGHRVDPSEEPATVFLLRSNGGPTPRPDPAVAGLKDVALPEDWCWARFAEVASIESNLVEPNKYLHLPHVAPDNIEKATGRLLEYRTIREDGVISWKHHFFPGQILYSKIRPNLSKVVVVDFEGLCSADMYPLRSRIDARYLQIFLLSDLFLQQVVRADNRIAMPKVNQQQLSATVIALPPPGVQKRIVARVSQIMALCDELEARLMARDQKAGQLAEALVASASQSPACKVTTS